MSSHDKQKSTENFAKPAEFKGTQEQYNETVSQLANAFRYCNPHADRGFHKGGIYYPVRADDVKRAIGLKYQI